MPNTIQSQKKHLPIIAVLGVDGSGKSTVLKTLVEKFEHELVRDIYILDRPYRRPAKGWLIQNYEKPPHSMLVSIVKLICQTLWWMLKYHLKFFLMKRSGTLILCDHFYFLGIQLDPLKYRYGGPQFFIKWVFRMIPQPDIYIYLDAPLEVVYSCKQEATKEEMDQFINRHREYVSGASNAYIVNAANPVEQVTADISKKNSSDPGGATRNRAERLSFDKYLSFLGP